jgi:transcriptional regulator of arginine metabolism
MSRKQRLRFIRDLIKENKINSQDELIEHLEKNGYEVTQSTISRDLRHLGVVKIRDIDQKEYYGIDKGNSGNPVSTLEKLKQRFSESVVEVNLAKNLIVIKTLPGEAQSVAVVIDGMNYKEMLGTVAGDDTILCIIDNDENASKLKEFYNNL